MPFQFDWGVNDDDSGNQYMQRVESDGAIVNGEYRVLLPDGRTQVVKFNSNPDDGYTADVTYL